MVDAVHSETAEDRMLHVLVVDDNRPAADSLCMLLRMWGYDCRVAYDGIAGLQAALDYRPDCLLMDICMPGMDGFTLASRLRRQPELEGSKLVALTAFSDEDHIQRAREVGFDHYFVKPADLAELWRLLGMMEEVMRLASRTEELARQNVALATETRELLQGVKEDIRDVKQELHEVKQQLMGARESGGQGPADA
jgi:CheY-like chemotaxis protein